VQETPAQVKQRLGIVQSSRDFTERVTSQAIVELEEALTAVKAELAACKKAQEVAKSEASNLSEPPIVPKEPAP
jgi:hypothetical protein